VTGVTAARPAQPDPAEPDPAQPDAAQPDQADLVRRGYDALSYRYRADDAGAGHYAPWLERLLLLLPPAAAVLDLGCGCGVPVARTLADAGHHVTGVDISGVQVGRARALVPAATFIEADATRAEFGDDSFDAIVSLYALIHMPLAAQPGLLRRVGRWLRPSGWLLASTGHDAWTGSEQNWLGGTAPMYWSHADAAVSRRWIQDAGLVIAGEQTIPEGDSAHALFWAQRPGPAEAAGPAGAGSQ